MKRYIMALDQGTTSSRCIILDQQARQISSAQKEFAQIYPKPGWVEHDPNEIWASQFSVAAEAMAKAGIHAGEIASIGITNQRETVVVWDKETGLPVYNAIVWQCRRTAERIEEFRREGFDQVLREKTGLIPDAYFSATKLEWILDHVEGARARAERGELLWNHRYLAFMEPDAGQSFCDRLYQCFTDDDVQYTYADVGCRDLG